MTIQNKIMENFEVAFSDNHGCSRHVCNCGIEYYNPEGGWSWEEGELEALEKDDNSISIDYSVPIMSFENKEYVMSCDCWVTRAEYIIGFIKNHGHKIAEFLNLEKKRKTSEAEQSPIVT